MKMDKNTALLTYTATKRDGLWWVMDSEGYEVSYVGYETKKEAMKSARIRKLEDSIARFNTFYAQCIGFTCQWCGVTNNPGTVSCIHCNVV
jgi:hypothetical protein